MASTQDFLFGQQSINPFAQQALQTALQSGDAQAQAQYQAALGTGLTDPRIAQAQTNAMTPTLPASRANQQNLNFGSLAALASATPQYGFTPQATPDAAVGAGVTSAANFQQQVQAQRQIADIINQQQQAILAEQQARQQQAQTQAQQTFAGLKKALPDQSDETILALIAAGKAPDILNAVYNPLASQFGKGLAGVALNQQLTGVDPVLGTPQGATIARDAKGNAIGIAPLTPAQQAQAGMLVGGDFNQFQPTINLAEAEKTKALATEEATKAKAAPQLQAQELTQGELTIQTSRLGNALKNVELQLAPMEASIKQLEAQGKLDEAALKRSQMAEVQGFLSGITAGDLAKATPQDVAIMNAKLKAFGIDASFPVPEAPKTIAVKTGKDTQDIYTINPQGGLSPLVIGGKPQQPAGIAAPTPQAKPAPTVRIPALPAIPQQGIVIAPKAGYSQSGKKAQDKLNNILAR